MTRTHKARFLMTRYGFRTVCSDHAGKTIYDAVRGLPWAVFHSATRAAHHQNRAAEHSWAPHGTPQESPGTAAETTAPPPRLYA